MRRRTRVAGLVVVCTAIAVAGCGCAGGDATAVTARPGPVPSAAVRHGVCVTPRPLFDEHKPAHGLVTVDPHPDGLTAFWIPGLNQRPCRSARAEYGASVATTLARAIRSAPKFPAGAVSCPNDDGSAVDLYFSYGVGQPSQYVWVGLRGCTSVGAPGRGERRATGRLLAALAGTAPQPWRSALTQWIH